MLLLLPGLLLTPARSHSHAGLKVDEWCMRGCAKYPWRWLVVVDLLMFGLYNQPTWQDGPREGVVSVSPKGAWVLRKAVRLFGKATFVLCTDTQFVSIWRDTRLIMKLRHFIHLQGQRSRWSPAAIACRPQTRVKEYTYTSSVNSNTIISMPPVQ